MPGAFLLFQAFAAVLDQPRFPAMLSVLLLGYVVTLLRFPRSWLLVLPVLSVALDLTAWSGRFLFNELDAAFLSTIGLCLFSNRLRVTGSVLRLAMVPLLFYEALLVLGLDNWQVFLRPPAQLTENPYYAADYGYKLLRGVLWGTLLSLLWIAQFQDDRKRTLDATIAGACVASLALGAVILWERETLGVLMSGAAWYHVLNSLLDLGSSYRVTGLFSDMHTGGEVLDGMIVVLLPLALLGIGVWHRPAARGFAALAVLALGYCTLVGFTRATYAAVALVLACFFAWLAVRNRDRFAGSLVVRLSFLAALPLAALAGLVAFRSGGSYALAALIGIYGLAFLASGPRRFALRFVAPLALALVLAGVYAHLTSRWATPSPGSAVLLSLALLASGASAWVGLGTFAHWRMVDRGFIGVGLITLAVGAALALGGYQFNSRMESVGRDMETRMEHWSRVIESGDDGLAARWFGNGVGSFPRNYFITFPSTVEDVGSYAVGRDSGSYLRLGAGRDLAFGQRVAIQPRTPYRLVAELRSDGNSRLVVFLCERNVLFASNFGPNCARGVARLEPTGGEFRSYPVDIDSGRVGERPAWARWPTVLYLKNLRDDTTVDIRSLTLIGGDRAMLRNGDFSSGTDHWFFYNDFAHLPWHIKNTFLHVWYETGWVGLTAFMLAVVIALIRSWRCAPAEPLFIAFGCSILGLMLVGLFGTPLDSARVSWLFFLILSVSTVARPRAGAAP